MTQFLPILKDLNEKLDLPQPAKSHILLEISADMEDLYEQLCNSGEEEKAAAKKVADMFCFTDSEIAELVSIHQTFFRKVYGKLSAQTQILLERTLLIITFLAIAALAAGLMLTTDFFTKSSAFIYPVIVFAGVGLLLFFIKFYELYIKKDHSIKSLHTGVNPILIIGGFSFVTGVLGYYTELHNAQIGGLIHETQMYPIFQSILGEFTLIDSIFLLTKTAKLLLLSLHIGLFSALMWFLLFNKISLIEQTEAEVLLEKT